MVSISEVLGVGKFLQSVLQMIFPPKIEGYIAERDLVPDFEAAVNGGWDVRDLLVYVKIANTRSTKTSVMDWVAEVNFSDGSSRNFTLSQRSSTEWLNALAGRQGGPLDMSIVFERNVTHEGWLWFRVPVNMKGIDSFRVLAIEPNKREHIIASGSFDPVTS